MRAKWRGMQAMMAVPAMIPAVGLTMAGIGALRFSWLRCDMVGAALRRVGWAALALALLVLGRAHGAWGVSVVSACAMLTAMALLAYGYLAEPSRVARAARVPTSEFVPELHGWRDLVRRLAVFLLAVPGAGGAALLSGRARPAQARAGGWVEANGIALGLLAWPTIWAALVTWAMCKLVLRSMLQLVLGTAAIAAVLFWLLR